MNEEIIKLISNKFRFSFFGVCQQNGYVCVYRSRCKMMENLLMYFEYYYWCLLGNCKCEFGEPPLNVLMTLCEHNGYIY